MTCRNQTCVRTTQTTNAGLQKNGATTAPTPDVWFLPGGGEVQVSPGYKEIQLNLMDEAEEPITLVEARALALALLAAVEKHEQEQA